MTFVGVAKRFAMMAVAEPPDANLDGESLLGDELDAGLEDDSDMLLVVNERGTSFEEVCECVCPAALPC